MPIQIPIPDYIALPWREKERLRSELAASNTVYLIKTTHDHIINDFGERAVEYIVVDPGQAWHYCSPERLITAMQLDDDVDPGLGYDDTVDGILSGAYPVECEAEIDADDLATAAGDPALERLTRSSVMFDLAEYARGNGLDYESLNVRDPDSLED